MHVPEYWRRRDEADARRLGYPTDPGLISLYERTGRANLGLALETVVLLELERRGCEIDYVRNRDGYEVDFFARNPAGGVTLIQVFAGTL